MRSSNKEIKITQTKRMRKLANLVTIHQLRRWMKKRKVPAARNKRINQPMKKKIAKKTVTTMVTLTVLCRAAKETWLLVQAERPRSPSLRAQVEEANRNQSLRPLLQRQSKMNKLNLNQRCPTHRTPHQFISQLTPQVARPWLHNFRSLWRMTGMSQHLAFQPH